MFVCKNEEKTLNDYYGKIFDNQERYYGNLEKLQKISMGNCYWVSDNNEKNKKPIDGLIWKSFDEKTFNFHIVPDNRELIADVSEIRKKIGKECRFGRGKMPWTKGHWWIECKDDNYAYLLLFQTLIFESNELNCYLDKIQFCKYPIDRKGPNFDDKGNFECKYPKCKDEKNDTFTCTDLVLGTSSVENIVNAFEKYINKDEEQKKNE